jgi:8-oxo-dGTP pyrophosphatase MutT (NUDIX family)
MDIFSQIAIQARNTIHEAQCNSILASSNPFSRVTTQGHITASGLVVKDGEALLIFHPYIKRWFQPGGHIDEGDSPIEAAIREVYEETGYVCELDSDSQDPIDIDIHEIPENPKKGEGAHLHIDLLYRLRAVRQEQSVEDIEYRWFAFSDIESIRIQCALAKLD